MLVIVLVLINYVIFLIFLIFQDSFREGILLIQFYCNFEEVKGMEWFGD